jgi:hypothetical protein
LFKPFPKLLAESQPLFGYRLPKTWPSLFTTLGCLSNIAYTCTLPFVAIGIIAGTRLTRQRAVISALMIWLANQIFGYTWHSYPRTTPHAPTL